MATDRVVEVMTADNNFQHLEVLKRNRTKRHQSKEIFVEGVRPINLAIENGWVLSSVAVAYSKQLSRWAQGVCDSADRVLKLPDSLMQQLSDKEEPSELVATFRIKESGLHNIEPGADLLLACLDRPKSPGNIGTIIRSAQAMGAHGTVILGHAADPFDPLAIRASIGAVFSLPVVSLASTGGLSGWIAKARSHLPLQVIGTDSSSQTPIQKVDFTLPTVVILGNEAGGMSVACRNLCDVVAAIPMANTGDSLNVAAAASIVFYEARRQRSIDR